MVRNAILAPLAVLLGTQIAGAAETELHFWSWSPAETVLEQVAEAFEAKNPGVDVVVHWYESTAYQDRMPLALASGDPMDVVAVQTSTMVDQVRYGLVPLPAALKEGAGQDVEALLVPSVISQARSLASDGELYIAPMGTLGSAAIYYNGEILDELGLDVPATRAELSAFVDAVKEKRPEMLPISFTGAGWFLDEIALTFVEQGAPGWFNSVRYNKGGSWNSPEYKAGFDALVSLYKDGIFATDSLDLDYGRAASLFQEGKAAAYMQGTWENGYLSARFREGNGINLTDIAASGLPVVVEGGSPAIRSFIEVGLGIAAHSEKQELAAKFIEFMIAGEGVDQWADTLLVVPSSKDWQVDKSLFNTERAEASFQVLSNLLQNPASDRNNVSDFSNVVGDVLIDAIISGTPSEKSVEHLQSEWDSGRYSNVH